MRCASCRSYIPEGLPSPVTCPQCGRDAEQGGARAPEPPVFREASKSQPPAEPSHQGFAPFFTIRMPLAFGLAQAAPEPSQGSISFGPEGFSIVCDAGRRWEKLSYRDLSAARVVDDAVRLSVRDVDSRLTLYHPWLPAWVASARRKRARLFIELLERVKRGLTPSEVGFFRRKLQQSA